MVSQGGGCLKQRIPVEREEGRSEQQRMRTTWLVVTYKGDTKKERTGAGPFGDDRVYVGVNYDIIGRCRYTTSENEALA